ncbi:MAG: 5-formyltetrahydrofolate cyclo-ligase [Bacteroidales bacterium]|nr:5-formyltetrahydrofolate cyclo-ligase [Clostridium sp.]MCM1204660.1 5-formyltetrahydrofolate cyclo-ligase [Bacteroidales bacterium]
MNGKGNIRKAIMEKRCRLTAEEVENYSLAIAHRLTELNLYKECRNLCVYQAFRNEVSCDKIMRQALSQGKRVFVPVTVPEKREMEFYRITENTRWQAGAYGIREPVPVPEAAVLEEKALILMPGLAFDRSRHRIGYGGGYYDRYLVNHPEHTTIALCYPFQITENHLPAEPHDILPDYILTAEEIF